MEEQFQIASDANMSQAAKDAIESITSIIYNRALIITQEPDIESIAEDIRPLVLGRDVEAIRNYLANTFRGQPIESIMTNIGQTWEAYFNEEMQIPDPSEEKNDSPYLTPMAQSENRITARWSDQYTKDLIQRATGAAIISVTAVGKSMMKTFQKVPTVGEVSQTVEKMEPAWRKMRTAGRIKTPYGGTWSLRVYELTHYSMQNITIID